MINFICIFLHVYLIIEHSVRKNIVEPFAVVDRPFFSFQIAGTSAWQHGSISFTRISWRERPVISVVSWVFLLRRDSMVWSSSASSSATSAAPPRCHWVWPSMILAMISIGNRCRLWWDSHQRILNNRVIFLRSIERSFGRRSTEQSKWKWSMSSESNSQAALNGDSIVYNWSTMIHRYLSIEFDRWPTGRRRSGMIAIDHLHLFSSEVTEECLQIIHRSDEVIELVLMGSMSCQYISETDEKISWTFIRTSPPKSTNFTCPTYLGRLTFQSDVDYHLKRKSFRMSVGCDQSGTVDISRGDQEQGSERERCRATWQSSNRLITYLLVQSGTSNSFYCLVRFSSRVRLRTPFFFFRVFNWPIRSSFETIVMPVHSIIESNDSRRSRSTRVNASPRVQTQEHFLVSPRFIFGWHSFTPFISESFFVWRTYFNSVENENTSMFLLPVDRPAEGSMQLMSSSNERVCSYLCFSSR